MRKVIKISALILFVFFHNSSFAQLKSAIVGVDGLTCSACSFATEKSILKLEFVDSVRMDLEKNIAFVYFKKDANVSLTNLAQKVVDAGFAVRSIFILVDLKEIKIVNDFCLPIGNDVYHFVKISNEVELNGLSTIRIIGYKFMSKKEFKNWKLLCASSCSNPISATVISSKTYYATLP